MHEFFSFNFALREYFFVLRPPPPPDKFSKRKLVGFLASARFYVGLVDLAGLGKDPADLV